MPSKRKASPASNPESGSASRKSKRLAEVKQQPPVVQLADDSDFEAEPVLSTGRKTDKKKQSGRKELKNADPSVAPVSASDDCEFEAKPVVSTSRKTENKKQSNKKGAKKDDSPVAPVPTSDDLVAETSDPAVDDDFVDEEDEIEQGTLMKNSTASSPSKRKPKRTEKVSDEECLMIGDPISDSEARQRWPHRYIKGNSTTTKSSIGQDDLDELIQAKSHFSQAKVDGYIYNLEDCAHVQAESGNDDYICKITEFFKGVDGADYFRAQWFYRAKDTVIKNHDQFIDKRRVFLSEMKDDNPLDCLLRKIKIVAVPPNASAQVKKEAVSDCDFFYDMMYLLPYSSFIKLPLDATTSSVSSSSTISSDTDGGEIKGVEVEKKLLDLYSGCGAMSTGLCLGANSNGVKLVTKWSVDFNMHACDSLRLNHPETQVRHEKACDFLSLLKEWVQLCASCSLLKSGNAPHPSLKVEDEVEESDDEGEESGDDQGGKVFEVEELLEICYGDPNEIKKPGLYFKVRWQGYGEDEDTWEPIDGLSNCPKKIKEFVVKGFKTNLLPLPGDVDVVSGGPPCQGISGFNRFRNANNPLEDEKNGQLLVYMDIVEFLKPRFVLMENVVDLLKFANGHLGRFALSRLVGMNYQARAGMMAAGSYGLPQFRMRVFMWGALMSEKLPQYPLPTHKVIYRGVVPTEFDSNVVAYEKGQDADLKKELFLGDALSDLPPVENNECRDEMPYTIEPETDFQRFIRLGRDGALGTVLYDHRPLQLNVDDYQRVCRIPKHKGANFRHLPGVRVRADNKVEWDPAVERVYLPSKKPLVPDYAMTFVGGSSSKPFARLWWDETVPTVVTRAEPHNQAITHPVQDRVLTIRENARLQGFPDYYKLTGPIKERYMQVGNAVAVPVARALGYSLALAMKGLSEEAPLLKLPEDFPLHIDQHNEVSQ